MSAPAAAPPRRTRSFRRPVALVGAALALIGSLFSIERTAPHHDGAQYWAMADRLAEFGGGFYVGAVDHKGPLWVGAFRLARWVTGDQAWYWFVIAIEAIVLAFVVALCAQHLARRVVGDRAVVTVATGSILVLMLLGPEPYSQGLFGRDITSAMASIAVVALVASLADGRRRAPALVVGAGLLMGLATQTVLTTGAPTIMLAGAVWFVETDRRRATRRAGLYLAAAVTGFATAPIWYALRGSGADFQRYFWEYNLVYGSSSLLGRITNALSASGRLILHSGYWAGAAAGGLFALWYLWRSRRELRDTAPTSPLAITLIVTAWWVGELISVMGPDRYYGHYWSLLLAPSAVLAALMWTTVFDRFVASKSTRANAMVDQLDGTRAFRHLRAMHFMSLPLKLLLVPVVLIGLQSLPVMVDGLRTAARYRGPESHLAFDLENVPSSVAALRPVAAVIAGPDEPVFAWSPVAEVFVVVDRPSATRFDRRNWITGVVYGSDTVVPWPHLEADLLADLRESEPRLVVEVLDDPIAVGSELHDYVTARYRPIYESTATFPVRVYAPRSEGGAPGDLAPDNLAAVDLAAVDPRECRSIAVPPTGTSAIINVHGFRQHGTFTIEGSAVVSDRGPVRYADVDDDRAVTAIPEGTSRLTLRVADTSALLWAGDMIVGALDLPGRIGDVTFEGVTPTDCAG